MSFHCSLASIICDDIIYYAYYVSLEYNVSLFQGFCDFCLFLGFRNLTMKSLIAFLCVYFGFWWVPPNTWSALLVIYRKFLTYVFSDRFFTFILSLLLVSTHRTGHLTVSISHWELFISFQCIFHCASIFVTTISLPLLIFFLLCPIYYWWYLMNF